MENMSMPMSERRKEFVNSLVRALELKSAQSEIEKGQKLLVGRLWALAEEQIKIDGGNGDEEKLRKYTSKLEKTEAGRGLMNLAASLKELIEDDGVVTRTALVRFMLKK